MMYNPRDENSIKAVMGKANVVLNLIGLYIVLGPCSDCEKCLEVTQKQAGYLFNWLFLVGREYETRNFSFEEVNHAMAEKLAVVAICFRLIPFLSLPCSLGHCISTNYQILVSKHHYIKQIELSSFCCL
uniref:NADH dehydrogenase [ubiquinone] 1 alpha subcomplex subunit 9, mitochondrial n=1 Tax=Anthurium amnicola TaxID=1678845 RepID=A0A1D1Y0S5_9ARAE